MSYEPHTWASGETITAAKLNALEQGVAGGGSEVVHYSAIYDDMETYQINIEDAAEAIEDVQNGKIVIIDIEHISNPGIIAVSSHILSWDSASSAWFTFFYDNYGSVYTYNI